MTTSRPAASIMACCAFGMVVVYAAQRRGISGRSARPPRCRGIPKEQRPLYNVAMIFHVKLTESDGMYVVECPALPGCVSQGRDEKEALDNIKEAIVGWLWAEDQKAVASLVASNEQPIVVAV